MIAYQEESYKIMWTKEFMELAKPHYKEVGGFKDSSKIKLAINWELYKSLGEAGIIKMFTVRHNKKLVGYNFYMVAPHPHYRNNVMAEADSIYVHPDYRRGLVGYALIKYAINSLKDKVDVITLNMHIDLSLEPLAKRLGFKPLERKFVLEV